MARLGSNFQFTGKLGNVSAYTMRGVDGVVLRTHGGAKAQKIKKSPVFKNTRCNNAEFGGGSKTAARMKDAVCIVEHLSDYNLSSKFSGLCRKIAQLDASGEFGKRGIYLSQHKDKWEGFSFNKGASFDTVIRHPLTCVIKRDQLSASVQLPALYPGINFYIPGRYPLFRLITALSIVPDMIYVASGYQPATTQRFQLDIAFVRTDWSPIGADYTAQTVNLQLQHTLALEDTVSLVVSVGIEFGMPAAGNEIKPIQHAGCARILMLG